MATATSTAEIQSTTTTLPRKRLTVAKKRQYRAAYLFVLPFFIIFLAMIIVPLGYAGLPVVLQAAARRRRLVRRVRQLHPGTDRPGLPVRRGPDGRCSSSSRCRSCWCLSLFFALALDSGMIRLAKFVRLGIYVPYAVPAVVATLMWGYLYGPDFGPFAQLADAARPPEAAVPRAERRPVLDRQHRELGVHRLQHDHHLRGAAVHPHRAVRGRPGRRRRSRASPGRSRSPRSGRR